MGRLQSQSTKQPCVELECGVVCDHNRRNGTPRPLVRAKITASGKPGQSQPSAPVGLRNVNTLAEEQVHPPHPQPSESGVVGGPSAHQGYLQ